MTNVQDTQPEYVIRHNYIPVSLAPEQLVANRKSKSRMLILESNTKNNNNYQSISNRIEDNSNLDISSNNSNNKLLIKKYTKLPSNTLLYKKASNKVLYYTNSRKS